MRLLVTRLLVACALAVECCGGTVVVGPVTVRHAADTAALRRPLPFAAREIAAALRAAVQSEVAVHSCSVAVAVATAAPPLTVTLLASRSEAAALAAAHGHTLTSPEDYLLLERNGTIIVVATGGAGAMYGGLELAERIAAVAIPDDGSVSSSSSNSSMSAHGLLRTAAATAHGSHGQARFGYRALKINLPWSPYRDGPATSLQMNACRNLTFWKDLLDLLAKSRFNVLSIWSEHPWPYMIRPHNFPLATPFNDSELAEWQALHRGIFALAKDRAITPALVDWNVFVSEAYKLHYEPGAHSDTDGGSGPATVSALANQYNRECITQTLHEYPDLGGIGLSLGDRVSNLNLTQQLDYAHGVIIAGIKAAGRPVKLIYRAPFGEGPGSSNSPAVARKAIEAAGIPAEDLFVQIKFNWSHGHSTVRFVQAHGGGRGEAYYEPPSDQYAVTYMVRNEDFFFLRWGGADFIRQHIQINGKGYVGGYALGSEGNIPAFDYAEVSPSSSAWMFEKQWLLYSLWGRLLYDPTTPDATFSALFESRYGPAAAGQGAKLFKAYGLVSIVPLRIACAFYYSMHTLAFSLARQIHDSAFVYNTWDYTLHSEAFVQGVGVPWRDVGAKGFISIETLLHVGTLDPQLESIAAFVGGGHNASRTSPLQLAGELANASSAALVLLQQIRAAAASSSSHGYPAALEAELNDVDTWAALGSYFSLKLRAAVLVQQYRTGFAAGGGNIIARLQQSEAVALLRNASGQWDRVVSTTRHLKPSIPLFGMPSGGEFSWADLSQFVERDVALARISATCYHELKLSCGAKKTLALKGDKCEKCLTKKAKSIHAAGCLKADTAVWCGGS